MNNEEEKRYWLSHVYEVKDKIAEDPDANDHALTFVTAKCTQKTLPYTFKPLPGGTFSESEYGSISMDHFSGFGLSGLISWFTSCHYIPKSTNTWDIHICVTPKKDLLIEVLSY